MALFAKVIIMGAGDKKSWPWNITDDRNNPRARAATSDWESFENITARTQHAESTQDKHQLRLLDEPMDIVDGA